MKTITCLMINEKELKCGGVIFDEKESSIDYHDTIFWVYLSVYLALVLFAGLMSGLTMGLLSLDLMSLKVLQGGGKPIEKKYVSRIIPLVEKHHFLLVTLLLANAGAVEAMPIFMDKISNPIAAVCVSVTAVLFFGEIIPQAVCTRYGLAIGYYLAPLVHCLMFLLCIISWPLAKLLDCILGKGHGTYFRRAELKELVDIHYAQQCEQNEEPLSIDEALIIKGALDMKNKTVRDAFHPLEDVYMLDVNVKLDMTVMQEIIQTGHSRIPVYVGDKQNIVGLILVKALIMLDPKEATPISSVFRDKSRSLLTAAINEPLFDLLNRFQEGKSHMCIVKEDDDNGQSRVAGIITLEDVLEELIQEEIYDEMDVLSLNRRLQIARAKLHRSKSVAATNLLGPRPGPSAALLSPGGPDDVFGTSPGQDSDTSGIVINVPPVEQDERDPLIPRKSI